MATSSTSFDAVLVLEEELARRAELALHVRPGRGGGDEHQPFRVRVRQRREQHVVENGEDGGDRADRQAQRADDGGGEAGRAPQRAQRVAKRPSPAVQVEAHGLSSLWSGNIGPGGPQSFGERALAEVEEGGCERARGGHDAAPPVALPVEERVLNHGVAEAVAEGRGEEARQRPEQRLHERPRASPSRFSATAAVRFNRCVSSVSVRRPRADRA